MSKTDLHFGTVVEVTTTVGAEAPAQFSAIVCQRVWDRIAIQGQSILEACDMLGSGSPVFPLLGISLFQVNLGFGYAYIESNERERPTVLVAGHSCDPFHLPMPSPPEGAGCFGCTKFGIVTLTRKVTAYIQDIKDEVAAHGMARLRDGWTLNVDELFELAAASSPKGMDIYTPVVLNPERN